MRKMKKYIYPVAFSAIFMILLQVLIITLEGMLDNGSYAGIAWVVLFLGFWAFVAVPVYCAKYSKVIHKEKYQYLFAVYNGLVSPLLYYRPSDLSRPAYIIGGIWVLGVTVLFLVVRTHSEKQADNGGERVKFMFDYSACSCLWGVNGEGVLPLERFSISKELMEALKGLCLEYNSILNWEDPASGFVWTSEQIENFRLRAQQAYDALVSEIGETYEIQNLIDLSLGMKN